MSWAETCAVDERMKFVACVLSGEEAMAKVCRRFGVSRRVGYKWVARYREEGPCGLLDRSRAPRTPGNGLSSAMADRCVGMRREHPTWGPAKVRAFLQRSEPTVAWPAASTIGALFDREGLTVRRRLRRRTPPSQVPFGACAGANDVWCMDFKGPMVVGDGTACAPLTLADAHSRYLLRCQALGRNDTAHVWPILEAAFREFGLPKRLRSDNGPPFASCAPAGLSRLGVLVIKAGVELERIEPGKPQQNGRLERLHLTMLNDTTQPIAANLREQLDRLVRFQRLYNEERPHQALGNATPAQCYEASPRCFEGILRDPEYPAHYEVRRVRSNGEIKWGGQLVYVSGALVGEWVGLSEIEDGTSQVHFAHLALGRIAHRGDKLKPLARALKPLARASCGLVDNAARYPQGPQ